MTEKQPQVLTKHELSATKALLNTPQATIGHFRSVALSIGSANDISFLQTFIDARDESASRALTALFYWGCVAGIGSLVGRILDAPETDTTMKFFAPLLLKDSVILLGDVTAYQALESCKSDDSEDLAAAKFEVAEFLAQHDEAFRVELLSGKLWSHGKYIIHKVQAGIPIGSRFVWYLKTFWPDPEVYKQLLLFSAMPDLKLASLRCLIGFWNFAPTCEMLDDTPTPDQDSVTNLFNLTQRVFEMTRDARYLKLLETIASHRSEPYRRSVLRQVIDEIQR